MIACEKRSGDTRSAGAGAARAQRGELHLDRIGCRRSAGRSPRQRDKHDPPRTYESEFRNMIERRSGGEPVMWSVRGRRLSIRLRSSGPAREPLPLDLSRPISRLHNRFEIESQSPGAPR
ncbi:hypothetical protein EVAR_86530_1 [Eumeta japonica]|uniref:Uncharacterized protein n=1 Tax=Eumeta variegata TaxID=151549 RepID=A0A4C1VRD3_EUMVA|nr:hypothetical protein EVAR_86530_1 [Eumeta japonica]